MSKKKIARRTRVKPFTKLINYSHLMPTRYSFELDVKTPISSELLKDPAAKKEIRTELKKVLEEKYHAPSPALTCPLSRYQSGQSKWFFQKLRF